MCGHKIQCFPEKRQSAYQLWQSSIQKHVATLGPLCALVCNLRGLFRLVLCMRAHPIHFLLLTIIHPAPAIFAIIVIRVTATDERAMPTCGRAQTQRDRHGAESAGQEHGD
jgi:hypothetical protein